MFQKSLLIAWSLAASVQARAAETPPDIAHSGNPLFPGWYADPEAIIIGNEYWIYPTYSAPFKEQLHFDQFVFLDKNGQYYMIYGGWSHCNIAKLKADFTGFTPFEDGTTFKEITPEGYVEGPFMFRRGGKYYFMWSEGNWTGPDYSVAYAIADSPMGPFQRKAKVMQQDPQVGTGAGHHSVIHDPKADLWYAVYHRRPLTETNGNHRVTCIDRMEFDAEGLIKPIQLTHQGVASRTLDKSADAKAAGENR